MWPKLTIWPRYIPVLAKPLRQIEDNCDREDMVFARQLDEPFARLRLHIGGIDHSQLAAGESFADDRVEQVECVSRRRLVVFVVGDQASAEVGGNNLRRQKMLPPKR
jgi:hypothetical protein